MQQLLDRLWQFTRRPASLRRASLLGLVVALLPLSSAAASTVTATDTGHVDAAGTIAQVWSINVTDLTVPIHASLTWSTTAANLNMYLTAPGSSTVVAQTTGTAQPKVFNYSPTVTGTYKVRVKAQTGASDYTLQLSYGQTSGGSGIGSYSKTYGFADTQSMFPYGTAYDPTDNTILVGDYWNYRIQRYSNTGQHIATYRNAAGAGVGAPYGVTVDPNDTSACGNGNPATNCADYWVADQEQADVVEFDHTGHVVRTFGPDGTGTGSHPTGCGGGDMTYPTDIMIDPSNGNVYVSDVRCKNVYEFSHTGSFIGQFDWTGFKTATGVGTPTPRGIVMDENGNVYVLEFSSRRIVVFNRQGQYQRVFPQQIDMNDGRGLAIDTTHDLLYAIGALKQRLFKFNYAGTMLKEIDSPTGSFGVKTDPKFNSIRFPAVDSATGNVYAGDTWGYRIWGFNSSLQPLSGFTSTPSPPADGGYTQQTGVAIVPAGGTNPERLYVAGSFDQRVQIFNTGSDCRSAASCPAFLGKFGTRVNPAPNATGFDYPKVMQYFDGKLWIGENDGNDIQVYNPDGTWVHRFGQQGSALGQFKIGVMGLALATVNSTNYVFATDLGNCRLQVWTESTLLGETSGTPAYHMGSCGTGAGQMDNPRGIAIDGTTAYVLETGDSRISVWNWQTQTLITTYRPSCGGKNISGPWGAAWDPSHTWIYIGDKANKRVVRWNPTTHACDVVTTGADTPEGALGGPDFLNFSPNGTLYVSDNNKHVYSFTITG
jgi:sugar lactone lactonase YvrE